MNIKSLDKNTFRIAVHPQLKPALENYYSFLYPQLSTIKLMSKVENAMYFYSYIDTLINFTKIDLDFANISRDTLVLKLGQDGYYEAKQTLLNLGVITLSNYSTGNHFTLYKIVDKWLITMKDRDSWKPFTIKDSKLINRLVKYKVKKYAKTPECYMIEKMSSGVSIAIEDASEYLTAYIEREESKLYKDLEKISIENIVEYKNKIKEIRDLNTKGRVQQQIIDRIYYQDNEVIISIKNGRAFYNLTQIMRELRQFLFIRETGVFDIDEVDIKNCQSFLLSILLDKTYSPTDDRFKLFYDLSVNGQLYEFIAKECGVDRDTAKEYINANFLFLEHQTIRESIEDNRKGLKTKTIRFGKIQKWFKEYFKVVYDLTKDIKKRNRTNEIKGRQWLAYTLQGMESKIVINETVPMLQGFVGGTIHDSVLCDKVNSEFIKETLEQNCIKLYGVKPTIKIKG